MNKLMGEDDEQKSTWGEFNKACTLSYKTRITAFVILFVIGAILTILAAIMVLHITTSPADFAVPYCIGAVCSLLSTVFLMGPCSQLKKMFARTRVIATVVYLLSIVGTLIVALVAQSVVGTILMVIVQILALMWYSLSYIPYARTACLSCCRSAIST